MADHARRTGSSGPTSSHAARERALVGMESMRVYPRRIDLSGYEASTGIAKNGSPYTTLRHDGLATITAFGHAGEALKDAWDRGDVVRVDSYERSGTIKVVAIACPLTGLPIGQDGRMEPTAQAPVFEAPPEPEPEGLWDRMVDAVQDMLGIDDEPKPEPVLIREGRTGYPFVDGLIDDIREQLMETPDLTDLNGGRFDFLVERHLPRLAAQHADAVRGAGPEETRLADAMLSESLKVTRVSLDETLRAHRSVKLDALAIEMNFLRSRQGLDSTFAPQLTIEPQRHSMLLMPSMPPTERMLPPPSFETEFGLQARRNFVEAYEGRSSDSPSVGNAPRSRLAKGPVTKDPSVVVRPTLGKGPKGAGPDQDPAVAMHRRMLDRRGFAA